MGEMRNSYKILVGIREGKTWVGIDGRIILEWISGKKGERVQTGCIWLRIGAGGRPS
jgi:hypothetical protein